MIRSSIKTRSSNHEDTKNTKSVFWRFAPMILLRVFVVNLP